MHNPFGQEAPPYGTTEPKAPNEPSRPVGAARRSLGLPRNACGIAYSRLRAPRPRVSARRTPCDRGVGNAVRYGRDAS